MWDWLTGIFTNPMTYAIIFGMALLAYGALRSLTKVFPVINKVNKAQWLMIGGFGFLILSGVLGSVAWNTGSLNGGGIMITDLQVTTAFKSNSTGTGVVDESTGVDDLIDIRLDDTSVDETSGIDELETGIITVTRSGDLEPDSCTVRCILPQPYANEATDDGTRYNILERTTVGEYECYLADGAAATTSSPKEKVSLSFSDGEASTTLGVHMEVDEEGHDALEKWSFKDVVVDVCGKPFIFRFHRMD